MPVTRSSSAAAALILGPASHRQPIHGIEAKVNNSESHALALSYTLIADINQFIIPPVATSRRIDGLWQHTCFEAFIGMKDGPAYYEFNFSPSSEWAAYQFRAYRDGWPLDDDAFAPKISVEQVADRLTLATTIRLDRLSLIHPGTTLRIGLTAVIEGNEGTLSYWALRHPAGEPDFHHADSFALELALPIQSA